MSSRFSQSPPCFELPVAGLGVIQSNTKKTPNDAALNECAPLQTSTRLLHVTCGPIRILLSPVPAGRGRGCRSSSGGVLLSCRTQRLAEFISYLRTLVSSECPSADVLQCWTCEPTACMRFMWWRQLKTRWIGELSPCSNLIWNIGSAGDIC